MAKSNELDKIKKELEKEGSEISGSQEAAGTEPDKDAGPESKPGQDSGESSPENQTDESGVSLGKKLGEIAKSMGAGISGAEPAEKASSRQPAAESPAKAMPDQFKKEISDIVKKRVDSKLSGIEENIKGLDKISSLESKINQISERMNSQMFQPPPQTRPVPGGGTSISKELASFGEEVDFQTEIYELKKTLAGLAKSFDTLSKKMEYRISVLEDRSKSLERIPDLEETLGDIRQKLGPENIQKLRKLIFSSDEIMDEVIPDLVTKKIRTKLDPALNEVREMQETINDFNSRLSHIKEEVLNLEKLRDDIQELRADKENLYKVREEDDSKLNDRIDVLKQAIRRKLEQVTEKISQEIRDIKKVQADTIQSEVKNSFLNLSEPRFSDLEKRQMLVDEKLKRMSSMDSELDKKISSIEAPENLKKWLDARISKIEREALSDIKALKRDDVKSAANIAAVAEDLRTFHVAMRDVPKRLDTQGNMINKLLDTKDYFAGRAEGLSVEMKSVSERLASLKAVLSGLEQRMAGQESRFTDSINRQRDYLTSAKEDLSKYLNNEIASIRKSLEKKSQEQTRTSLAEFKAELKRLSSTEEEIKAMRKLQDTSSARLQKQVSELQEVSQRANPEIKLLSSRLGELETAYKELSGTFGEAMDYHKAADSAIRTEFTRYVDSSLKSLQKALEARLSDDSKAQLKDFRQELKRLESLSQELSAFKASQEKRTDELSNALAGLSGPITDLKTLMKRVDELEDIEMATDKRLDSVEDRSVGELNSLANRLNLIEKAVDDIGSMYKELEKRVSSDSEQLQKALGQVISDRKALEKELATQRTRIGELIKELSA